MVELRYGKMLKLLQLLQSRALSRKALKYGYLNFTRLARLRPSNPGHRVKNSTTKLIPLDADSQFQVI
jgi:hypothetical protein